jgi:glycosyltransferase involved in cell wall biosynthesis
MGKKRVGISTSSPLVKTGFSKVGFEIAKYLYNTGKYEIYYLHHSISNNDPNFQRFPWHNQGALIHEVVTNPSWQDPNWQRWAAYGNARSHDFIVGNKLDIIILAEDIWAFAADQYYKQDFFQFCKNNTIVWTTCDSEPILGAFKDWIDNCPNVLFWTKFGVTALKNENAERFKNLDYLYGCINTDNYKLIGNSERQELRKKFNISDDTTLFFTCNRNQLRKLYPSNIEALARFKKQFPGAKAKMHFHTSWSECGGGWDLNKIRDEQGLALDDILATYFCMSCGEWEVKPYTGENLDCPSCGKKGTPPPPGHPCHEGGGCITAGVTSSITEQELSKIAQLSDAAISAITSGGFEYFIPESLLNRLPILVTNYSAGQDFCELPFVFPLDGTFYREAGTGFYKHSANINTIVKFIDKICKMPLAKRREIGQQGREWAIKNLDTKVIAGKIEKMADAMPALDWDKYHEKKTDYDKKVPDAAIPTNIESDVDFVKTLYRNILKMEQPDNDPGLLGWISHFHNMPPGLHNDRLRTRMLVEQKFREVAVNENQKNNPIQFKDLLDLSRPNKRLLFCIKESGGDIFICTALLKDLKQRYPDHDIYFMCDPKFQDILAGNEYIFKVLPWHDLMSNEMVATGAGQDQKDKLFDVFIMPGVSSQKWLNYLTNNNARLL